MIKLHRVSARGLRLWVAIVSFCFLLCGQAPADYYYSITDSGSTSKGLMVTLKSTTAPGTAASGDLPASGKGDLYVEIGGTGLLPTLLKKVSVDYNFGVQPWKTEGSDTYYRVTSGTYKVEKQEKLSLFGSGVDLIVDKEATFSVTSLNTSERVITIAKSATQPDALQLSLPFSQTSGTATQKSVIRADTLVISRRGVSGAGSASFNVNLPGITIPGAQLNWTLSEGSDGAPAAHLKVASTAGVEVTIMVDLPRVSSSSANSMAIKVKSLKLNEDGEISFDSAVATFTTPLKIELVNPAQFTISLKSLTLDMDEGEFESFSVKFDLELPPELKVPGNNGRVKIPDVTLELVGAQASLDPEELPSWRTLLNTTLPPINATWNGFKLKATGYKVDIDPDSTSVPGKETDPAWMGVYFPTATLTFPDEFKKGSTAPELQVKDFYVDSGGVTGKVTALPGGLGGFKAPFFKSGSIDELGIEFKQSRVVGFTGKGTVELTDLNNAELGVSLNVTGSGVFTLVVETAEPIKLAAFDQQIELKIDDGNYAYDSSQNVHKITVSGCLKVADSASGALSNLKGTAFGFQNLTIDSNGKFSLGDSFLDLAHPVKAPLGPIEVTFTQIKVGTKNSNPMLKLTGDISLHDLPITGSIGFDGVSIYKDSSGVKADWDGINVDLEIENVGHISGSLTKGQYPPAPVAAGHPWYGVDPVDMVTGNVQLDLECFGPSGGGISIDFMAAPKSWYVGGSYTQGQGIPLGSTGLSLFGFKGGVGRNVTSATGDAGMIGVPGVPSANGTPTGDYVLVPIPVKPNPNQSGSIQMVPKWLFVAGVRIGTADGFTAWGDVILTAGIAQNSFFIDLDGKFYLLEEGVGTPGPKANPDRRLAINLHYDSVKKDFRAYAQADLYFPDRTSADNGAGIYVYAPVELYLSKDYKFFRIGGDVTPNPGTAPTLTNPAFVKFRNFTGAGVVRMDLRSQPTKSFVMKAGAVLSLNATFSASPTKRIDIYGFLSAQAYVYVDAVFAGDPNGGGKLAFQGGSGQLGFSASIGGSVSHDIFGGFSFSASARGDLWAHLDSNYKLTANGTLTGSVSVSKFSVGFSTGFSIN